MKIESCKCSPEHSDPEVHDSMNFAFVVCGSCGTRGAYVEKFGDYERESESAILLWNDLMSVAKAGKAARAVLAEHKELVDSARYADCRSLDIDANWLIAALADALEAGDE